MQDDKIKVAFLDRDGVINREVNYLHEIEEFEYTEYCIQGLKGLVNLGFKLIIVTNQSGIARGYYSEEQYQILTKWYLNDLKDKGIEILDVFHCPHHPTESVNINIDCVCRKPKTGLIDYAMEKYNISLENSIIVGDKSSDIEVGIKAGVNNLFMVKTGKNVDNEFSLCPVVDNLKSVSDLLSNLITK
ncbi:TPA: D-glycero-alpha-D-manno-heptose-1,7-bisphosphate 7-phosphatase [Vibrio cholerae]